MELKKNPNADLRKNSNLYFSIGLALILGLVWLGMEWKSYEKNDYIIEALDMSEDLEEEVPITQEIKQPPPPPPPPAPEIIEVVEDEEEVEETIIESTETDQEEEIEEVEDIEVMEEEVDVSVPFTLIEDAPIFPGCEKVSKAERKKCFQDKMNRHIRKYFRYPEISQEMGVQGRVYVQFTIQKDGSIGEVRMRGPDKNLEKEAARIISKLPSMTPGKQRGKPVKVPFSIPIVFKLQ